MVERDDSSVVPYLLTVCPNTVPDITDSLNHCDYKIKASLGVGVPVFSTLSQEAKDHKLKASLVYTVRPMYQDEDIAGSPSEGREARCKHMGSKTEEL